MGVKQLTRRSRRRPVAELALVAGTLLAAPPAWAQTTAPAAIAADRQMAFAIPAQELNAAVLAFARASGLQVLFDAGLTQGRHSAGLSGTFSIRQGLEQLLAGSGLTYRFTASGAATLEPLPSGSGVMTLTPVTVEGQASAPAASALPEIYAGGQVARGGKLGLLGNRDLMDTPFNTTAYTAELIENQQARSIADVLQNDPSVRYTTSGGHVMENFTIRGFSVDADDLALNGMYGMVPDGHVPTEFLERVEVIKGPNALLAGVSPSGGVGGAINLVPKRAGDTPLTRIEADYTSDMQLGTHVDVGRRFGTDNRVGVRVNGVWRDGDTTLDDQSKRRILGAMAADYRGDNIRLTLDAFHTQERNDGGSPMMVGFASSVTKLPSAPDSSTNLFKGLTGEQDSTGGQARAEWDVTRDITLYAAVGGKTSEYSGLITSTQAISTTGDGDTEQKMINQKGVVHTQAVETGARGRFQTGPVGHQMSLGLSSLSVEEDKAYTIKWIATGNIYRSAQPYFPAEPGQPRRYSDKQLDSLAIADTLSVWDERAQLTLGARRQSLNVKAYTDNTGVLSSAYDKSITTPAVGLVVKPFAAPISLYGNYIEGLTQGGRVTDSSASNYGEVFAPFRTKQREIGVKWDAGSFTNTLSAFSITKPSLSTNSTTHVATQAEQTNDGVEWNVFGEVQPGLRALGGLSYVKSELTGTASGQYDGNEAWGTPHWQGNMGLEWDTPWVQGLSVNGRAVYTGSQYVNSANTLKVPDWWRFDIGARYVTNVREQDVTIRASVTNLFDRDYWVGSFSDGYVTVSSPRTFMLSVATDF